MLNYTAIRCIRTNCTPFINLLYDLALKLLGTPPLADAFEAVAVVAVGQDAEATLAGIGLLEHHLHTHTTHHVLTALDGKRDLHVLLVGLNACLSCTTAQHSTHFKPK